jgi:hypothetical protein
MEQDLHSDWKSIMNIAAIFGFAMVIFDAVFYFSNLTFSTTYAIIRTLVLIAGIVWCSLYIRNHLYSGFGSYGKIFWASVRIVFFAAIILGFYRYVLCAFIDKDYIANYFALAIEKIDESGLSENFKNKMMDQLEKQQSETTPLYMGWSEILNMVIWGAIISLITSIFIKKAANPFDKPTSNPEIKNLDTFQSDENQKTQY